MFFSKSTALKAILPVAGAALAAGVIGAAAPAQAMSIVIDDFSTATNLSTLGTQSVTSGAQTFSSNLGTVTRTSTLNTTRLVIPNRTNNLTIDSGFSTLALANNHSGSATLNYAFSSFDFSATPLISFEYDYDFATATAPVTFQFRLGSQTQTQTLTSGNAVANQVTFDFRNVNVSNVNSARLVITGGNGNDINVTSAIKANAVPVPPAVLATGVGAVIGGLKASRKRKQEAAMA
jgi:hypothetical protein